MYVRQAFYPGAMTSFYFLDILFWDSFSHWSGAGQVESATQPVDPDCFLCFSVCLWTHLIAKELIFKKLKATCACSGLGRGDLCYLVRFDDTFSKLFFLFRHKFSLIILSVTWILQVICTSLHSKGETKPTSLTLSLKSSSESNVPVLNVLFKGVHDSLS